MAMLSAIQNSTLRTLNNSVTVDLSHSSLERQATALQPLIITSTDSQNLSMVSTDPLRQTLLANQVSVSGLKLCPYCLTRSPHPRLGRGESYICGYKPYRCEVCNYSTTTKGNLAIHQQSDKHLNNIQEQEQTALQNQMKSREYKGYPENPPGCSPVVGAKRMLQSFVVDVKNEIGDSHPYSPRSCSEASHTIQPCPMFTAELSQLSIPPAVSNHHCSSSSAYTDNGQQSLQKFAAHIGTDTQPVADELFSKMAEMSPYPLACQVCCAFTTDKLESLLKHAERSRTPLDPDQNVGLITAHTGGFWFCKLCSYKSPLKANFQLHCKTEKHAQRLSFLLHVCEGGPKNQSRVFSSLVTKEGLTAINLNGNCCLTWLGNAANNGGVRHCTNMTSPVQLVCLACDVFTTSVHKFRIHCQSPRHVRAAELFTELANSRIYLWDKLSAFCTSYTHYLKNTRDATDNDIVGEHGKNGNSAPSSQLFGSALSQMSSILGGLRMAYVCTENCSSDTPDGLGRRDHGMYFSSLTKALVHWHSIKHQQGLMQRSLNWNSDASPKESTLAQQLLREGFTMRWILDELEGSIEDLPLLITSLLAVNSLETDQKDRTPISKSPVTDESKFEHRTVKCTDDVKHPDLEQNTYHPTPSDEDRKNAERVCEGTSSDLETPSVIGTTQAHTWLSWLSKSRTEDSPVSGDTALPSNKTEKNVVLPPFHTPAHGSIRMGSATSVRGLNSTEGDCVTAHFTPSLKDNSKHLDCDANARYFLRVIENSLHPPELEFHGPERSHRCRSCETKWLNPNDCNTERWTPLRRSKSEQLLLNGSRLDCYPKEDNVETPRLGITLKDDQGTQSAEYSATIIPSVQDQTSCSAEHDRNKMDSLEVPWYAPARSNIFLPPTGSANDRQIPRSPDPVSELSISCQICGTEIKSSKLLVHMAMHFMQMSKNISIPAEKSGIDVPTSNINKTTVFQNADQFFAEFCCHPKSRQALLNVMNKLIVQTNWYSEIDNGRLESSTQSLLLLALELLAQNHHQLHNSEYQSALYTQISGVLFRLDAVEQSQSLIGSACTCCHPPLRFLLKSSMDLHYRLGCDKFRWTSHQIIQLLGEAVSSLFQPPTELLSSPNPSKQSSGTVRASFGSERSDYLRSFISTGSVSCSTDIQPQNLSLAASSISTPPVTSIHEYQNLFLPPDLQKGISPQTAGSVNTGYFDSRCDESVRRSLQEHVSVQFQNALLSSFGAKLLAQKEMENKIAPSRLKSVIDVLFPNLNSVSLSEEAINPMNASMKPEVSTSKHSSTGPGQRCPSTQPRRSRTRLSEAQLVVLRSYFDINNSPSDEKVAEICMKTGLQGKVVKHWFRNTLFKERQRNKDNPYNFSVPPSTSLNLEEYEKTGRIEVRPASDCCIAEVHTDKTSEHPLAKDPTEPSEKRRVIEEIKIDSPDQNLSSAINMADVSANSISTDSSVLTLFSSTPPSKRPSTDEKAISSVSVENPQLIKRKRVQSESELNHQDQNFPLDPENYFSSVGKNELRLAKAASNRTKSPIEQDEDGGERGTNYITSVPAAYVSSCSSLSPHSCSSVIQESIIPPRIMAVASEINPHNDFISNAANPLSSEWYKILPYGQRASKNMPDLTETKTSELHQQLEAFVTASLAADRCKPGEDLGTNSEAPLDLSVAANPLFSTSRSESPYEYKSAESIMIESGLASLKHIPPSFMFAGPSLQNKQYNTFQQPSSHSSSSTITNSRRNRTSITALQSRCMHSIYTHHKTPSVHECDRLGAMIGLTRRVVQVWFQNQRAKEKKMARVSSSYSTNPIAQSASGIVSETMTDRNFCHLCGVPIPSDLSACPTVPNQLGPRNSSPNRSDGLSPLFHCSPDNSQLISSTNINQNALASHASFVDHLFSQGHLKKLIGWCSIEVSAGQT
ncbi:unnamed protein product [Calicophoron daubneyi]|uniref:Zinc finger homeobox protein 3 n=1 Tax=Calicophoron daubneyi TaxID=300641 RepID=A0AAV2TK82_CALDB